MNKIPATPAPLVAPECTPRRRSRSSAVSMASSAGAILALTLLAACGQKGPLVLPGHSKDTPWPLPPTPAASPAPVPVPANGGAQPGAGGGTSSDANGTGSNTSAATSGGGPTGAPNRP